MTNRTTRIASHWVRSTHTPRRKRGHRVAAAVTNYLGSMAALYVVIALISVWIVLAIVGPLQRFDPYPFAFLLFLNNVVQLSLCPIILLGQRVLGQVSDQRARDTSAITLETLRKVAEIRASLDRRDTGSTRESNSLESGSQSYLENDQTIHRRLARRESFGLNARLGARLTERLGSMTAFYLTFGSQCAWGIAAQVGVERIDHYPFAFMSLLSTLLQLLLMVVIMVGQRVESNDDEHRAEQTRLDAQSILDQCAHIETQLSAK